MPLLVSKRLIQKIARGSSSSRCRGCCCRSGKTNQRSQSRCSSSRTRADKENQKPARHNDISVVVICYLHLGAKPPPWAVKPPIHPYFHWVKAARGSARPRRRGCRCRSGKTNQRAQTRSSSSRTRAIRASPA